MNEITTIFSHTHETSFTEGQRSLLIGEHTFLVLHTSQNEYYFSIANLCEALHLNKPSQVRRIQQSENLSRGLRSFPVTTRGGKQRINCLLAQYVLPWLSSIRFSNTERKNRSDLQQELADTIEALLSIDPISPSLDDEPNLQLMQVAAESLQWHEMPDEEESFSDIAEQRKQEVLSHLPPYSVESHLTVTSYPEDRAIREATLAQTRQWEQSPGTTMYRYAASNKLHVYLGDPDNPLEIPDALEQIQKLGESTALTARIILGLWTIRHLDEKQSVNGSTAIRVDEILEWRGVKKHSHIAFPGSEKRYTDGYQQVHRQELTEDLKLLSQCYLRGHHSMVIKGRHRRILIDGPYLRVSSVKEQTLWDAETVGYFVSPGDWINTYQKHELFFFAEVDRRVFTLRPHNEQHELRLALFLTERWRQQAKQGNYDEPIKMSDLLAASMIPVDANNLTNRFVPRVEAALETLYVKGILGERARCLSDMDTKKSHWGKDWLASFWCLLPPLDLLQQYALHTQRSFLLGK